MSVAVMSRLASAIVLSCLLPVPSAAQIHGTSGGSASMPPETAFTNAARINPDAEAPGANPASGARPVDDQQEPQGTRRMPKVFGWLYQWVRGFDVERSTTPSPQLYLRSPLLAGFNEPVSQPEHFVEPRAGTCVAVTTNDGGDRFETYLVTLPHGGARTPDELEVRLRKRLGVGQRVLLRTLAGSLIKLDPARALEVNVKPCGSEFG